MNAYKIRYEGGWGPLRQAVVVAQDMQVALHKFAEAYPKATVFSIVDDGRVVV